MEEAVAALSAAVEKLKVALRQQQEQQQNRGTGVETGVEASAATFSQLDELPIKSLVDEKTYTAICHDWRMGNARKLALSKMAEKSDGDDHTPHLYEVEKYTTVSSVHDDTTTPDEFLLRQIEALKTGSIVLRYATFEREPDTKYYDNKRIKEIVFNINTNKPHLGDLCEVVGLSIRLSNLHSEGFREMLSWDETKHSRRAEILNSFITTHFQDLRVEIGGTVVGSYPIAYFSSISEPVLEEAWGNLYIKFPIKLTEFMSAFPFIALAFHCVKILLKYKEDSVIEDVELNVKQIALYSRELRKKIFTTGTQVAFETFSNIHFKQLDKAIDADEIVMPLRGVLRRGFFYFGDYTALSTIRFIGKTRKEGSIKKQIITFTKEDLKKYAAPIGNMGNVLYIPFNLEQKFVPINKKNPQVYLEGCFHPEADEIMVDLEWSIPVKTYGVAFIELNFLRYLNGMGGEAWSIGSETRYEYSNESNATIGDVAAAAGAAAAGAAADATGVGAGAEARQSVSIG